MVGNSSALAQGLRHALQRLVAVAAAQEPLSCSRLRPSQLSLEEAVDAHQYAPLHTSLSLRRIADAVADGPVQ
eukprot:2240623-Pyramimonas_sp.AAC.1